MENEKRFSLRTVLNHNGHLVVRSHFGLADRGGQLHFEFSHPQGERDTANNAASLTAADWFALGCEYEEVEQWEDAAHAYRQSLLAGGPDADACFNLANVLVALGQKEQAAERYRQVVEMAPDYAEAWNNLGNVLEHLEQFGEAIESYRRALESYSGYADAHYNLADVLERIGKRDQARPHWQAYVEQDATSEWGIYARKRLKSG